jgi:AraC family transcriptional regulator
MYNFFPEAFMTHAFSIKLTAYEKEQVLAARAYVAAHLHSTLEARAVAEAFGISVYKLQAGFVQASGRRFADEVKAARMARASELLLTTNKIVYDIARSCGYHNESSFTRAFRQWYGCPPDAYRKR